MIKNEILDLDKHYKLKLATNKELTKIKGYDFLNFDASIVSWTHLS
jgi:hypothetical protein